MHNSLGASGWLLRGKSAGGVLFAPAYILPALYFESWGGVGARDVHCLYPEDLQRGAHEGLRKMSTMNAPSSVVKRVMN